jgi:hypothetical protein
MTPHPLHAARRLQNALHDLGINGDVHQGHGLALVSVWADLVVWCDGTSYYWWSGRTSPRTGRRTYSYSPADDPVTTARRIAHRYAHLRRTHPLSVAMGQALPVSRGEVLCR